MLHKSQLQPGDINLTDQLVLFKKRDLESFTVIRLIFLELSLGKT